MKKLNKPKEPKEEFLTEYYFRTQREVEAKFGDRTAVFIEVGKFFEIYSYDPSVNGESGLIEGKGLEVYPILNIALTSKDSSKKHDRRSNPYMAGFPSNSYDRNRDLLLSHGYTVVKMEQVKKDGTSVIKREITEVASPGTTFSNLISNQNISTNNIFCLYLEVVKKNKKLSDLQLNIGVSICDVSTGSSVVGEIYNTLEDPSVALQEVYRYLLSSSPREIVIYIDYNDPSKIEEYKEYLEETLDLGRYPSLIFRVNEVTKEFRTVDYQSLFLGKLFPNRSSQTTRIIEYLGLGRLNTGRLAYLLLVEYCREHNSRLISFMKEPTIRMLGEENHLVLAHNAISQLNVTSLQILKSSRSKKRPIDSLFAVVNFTSTMMGKRFLHAQLTNPLSDPSMIEWRYDSIAEILGSESLKEGLISHLRNLPDIERLQHKLMLGMSTPLECSTLYRAYSKMVDLYMFVKNYCKNKDKNPLDRLLLSTEEVADLNNCLYRVYTSVDIEILQISKIYEDTKTIEINSESNLVSFLLPGVDPKHDSLVESIDANRSILTSAASELNNLAGRAAGKPIVYIPRKKNRGSISSSSPSSEEEEEDFSGDYKGYIGFATTITKMNKIKNVLFGLGRDLDYTFTTEKKIGIITSKSISSAILSLEDSQSGIERILYSHFTKMVEYLRTNSKFYLPLIRFIGHLDFFVSNVICSQTYKYFRPTVDNQPNSYFIATDLRHPIGERVSGSEYVPNDLSIGRSPNDNNTPYGVILYGINSCGKSNLLKAVGCNLILAQAGCYCSGKIRYSPYQSLMTRLQGNDDLFKGQSSFVVEMTELRSVLNQANAKTLTLIDELTRGTESTSGTALSIATILTLIKRKSGFIFTSHLHNIPEDPKIVDLRSSDPSALRICHLTVERDPNNELIYSRKLVEGSGSTIYGLEVAASLQLPEEFLSLAREIRNNLQGTSKYLVNPKRSKYNSNIFVDSCILCGDTNVRHLETHHLKHQAEADATNMIGYAHKNSKFNLTILCDKCHRNLHSNKLKIEPKQLLSGVHLTVIPDH